MSKFSEFNMRELRKSISSRRLRELDGDSNLRDFLSLIDEKYHISINDTPISFINPALAQKRGISDKNINEIKKLHISRIELFEMMSLTDPKDKESRAFLNECVVMLRDIEFLLQRYWGFEEDADWHSWWFNAPHCTCPKIDNAERIGTKFRIVSQNCPLHGSYL